MSRDSSATRAAILESAATIIAAHGVSKLGVNALASAARCDKVLIYRYFGGLEGVLASLGAERVLWPRVDVGGSGSADGADEVTLAEAVRALVLEEWAVLVEGALSRGAAAAEAGGGGGPLAAAMVVQRGESHERAIAALRESHRIPPYLDLPALVELLSAALTMLALRAPRRVPGADSNAAVHVGAQSCDPATPQGRRRIEKIVGAITRALLDTGAD